MKYVTKWVKRSAVLLVAAGILTVIHAERHHTLRAVFGVVLTLLVICLAKVWIDAVKDML